MVISSTDSSISCWVKTFKMNYQIFVIYITLTAFAYGYTSSRLNLEELQTSLYSLEIRDEPLPISEDTGLPLLDSDHAVVAIASNLGQKYVCRYKETAEKPIAEVDTDPVNIKITELLEPMRGYCLVKHKDWWSYEFCYGNEISQFHVQDGVKVGEIISLGKYDSDQSWLPEDLERSKKSPLNRFHTQKYVNGSVCDLTKKPRKTEVRFSCMEGEADHIGAVAELESCAYILFVYTAKICHHPYLRPPIKAKPSNIECQPLVSQHMYEQYVLGLNTENSEENLKVDPAPSDKSLLNEDSSSISKESVNDIKKIMGETFGLEPDSFDIEIVDAGSIDSITERVSQAIKTHQESKAGHTNAVPGENPASADMSKKTDEINKLESITRMLKELDEQEDKLVKDITNAESAKNVVSKYRENIKHVVSSQFDDIIDEARRELEQAGENVKDTVADIRELKKIMATLLDSKLDEFEGHKTTDQKTAEPDNPIAKHPPGKLHDLHLKESETLRAQEPTPGVPDAIKDPASKGPDAQPTEAPDVQHMKTSTVAGETEKSLSDTKSKSDIKVEVKIKDPRFEIEIMDPDALETGSDYYNTAQQQMANNEPPKQKSVIAFVKPMVSPSSRKEVKKQSELEKNYNKLWNSSPTPQDNRDEL